MIEPLTPVPLPRRGFASGMPYNDSSPEFTHECVNVLPFDCYEDKIRIATRQGLTTLKEKVDIDAGTGKVQFLGYYKVYTATNELKDGLIAIVDGEFFYNNDGTDGGGTWTSMQDTGSANAGTQLYPFNTDGSYDDRIQGVQSGNYYFFATTRKQDGTAANGATSRPTYYRVKLSSGATTVPQWELWLPTDASGGALAGVEDSSGGANDDHTLGHTPAGKGCTLISKFGARIVLSGQPSNPTNWYMSALPDGTYLTGFNWAFGTDTTGAIAGNSGSNFGELGDNIVGIKEFGSTGLLLGCTNSMVLLTNDPAFTGAEFKSLSNSVGLVGSTAWANSTGRSLYFVGTDGMYRVDENAFSVDNSNKISDGKLDDAFDQAEWDEMTPTVVYDQRRQGMWIFMTRTVAPLNSVHYFYHIPTDSFWPQVFNDPDFDGPTVSCSIRPADGQTMFTAMANANKICRFSETSYFGSDGYPDPDSSGVATPSWQTFLQGYILSFIKIGPFYNPQRRRTKIRSIEIDMDSEEYIVPQLGDNESYGSGYNEYPTPPTVDTFLLSGDTPEQAKGQALRNKLMGVMIDFGDLKGKVFDATDADATDGWVNESGIDQTNIEGGVYDATDDRWEKNDGTHISSYSKALDGNYTSAIGEYVVTNPFSEGQSREYSGPDTIVLVYESNYWRIKASTGGAVLFQSDTTGYVNPQDAQYYEDQTTTANNAGDDDYRTVMAVVGSPSASYSVKNLGTVPEGRSNRKNCNVNAPAHYLLIQALGRPIILEGVAASIEDGGPNLKNTQTVVT